MQVHEVLRNSNNPVVLAGDSHNAWAYNVIDPNTSRPLAVEFDDASVTPPGLDTLTQILPGVPKRCAFVVWTKVYMLCVHVCVLKPAQRDVPSAHAGLLGYHAAQVVVAALEVNLT